MRARAVLAEDKQERRDAILDAAERLLARSPGRIANVAEVADAAGLAKGTVYLYFPGKEELLLAVHERHIDRFFIALVERLDGKRRIAIEDLLSLTQSYIVDEPTFLPLATRCFGIMATDVPHEVAAAFKERMFMRLTRAGAALERHFPALPHGGGLALVRHSYALILGLYQMSSANADDAGDSSCEPPAFHYPEELARALRALWAGTLSPEPTTSARAAKLP